MSEREDDYRPISDYAIIGDAHAAALVSMDGSIDWCCWPHLDSPAVFCRLLDFRKGGWFRIGPSTPSRASRSYVGPTNVLATTFRTERGEARLIDFMPAERRRATGRGEDIEASHRIMRLVEGLAGDIEFDISFRPTFDYARAPTAFTVSDSGAIARGGNQSLVLGSAIPLRVIDSGMVAGRFRVSRGDRVWLTLTDRIDGDPGDPESALERTLAYWEEWAAICTYRGPYEEMVRRSALVLKLLTFEPSGALVAAPTTSLPEEIGGVRNWDYRYTWLRDSALILYALQSIGYHAEAMDFWDWLESLCLSCRDRIQIMYTLDGSRDLPEEILPHLEGYRGSRPVRIGNAAAEQSQLDVYGEVFDAAHLCYESMRSPHPQLWSVLGLMADRAAAHWREPDHGMWEVRSAARHYLYSKLLCWVALDRAVRLVHDAGMPGDVVLWQRTRDDIREAILTRGYDRRLQAFTQAFDAPALDASTLVIPLVGFLPPTDPRVRSTVRRIQERLTSNGLVYRYLTDDGLPGGEAAFALCTFWLIDNLALGGQVREARQLFERVIGYANDVGLLAEEINPVTRELLGNYPQGYTHLALIQSALNIANAETRGPEERAVRPAERARRLPGAQRDPVNRPSRQASR
jgi:GH15 family glucan-1,4-alpha-glucosidase